MQDLALRSFHALGCSLLVLALVLGSGCTSLSCCMVIKDETNEAVQYVVLGLGLVSVPKPRAQRALLATRVQSLGLVVTNQPGLALGIGYSAGSAIAIPSGTNNAVVEIRNCPGGGQSINAITGLSQDAWEAYE